MICFKIRDGSVGVQMLLYDGRDTVRVMQKDTGTIKHDGRPDIEIAVLNNPSALKFPVNSVTCISVWPLKMATDRLEGYDTERFLTLLNDDGEEWLGLGLYFDMKARKMVLYTSGVLDTEGKGLSEFIPVQSWHHVCMEIDMLNQTVAIAVNGILVIENQIFDMKFQQPTIIQVSSNLFKIIEETRFQIVSGCSS